MMPNHYPILIARRLRLSNQGGSSPSLTVAVVGVALAVVVMILAMAVTQGFRQEISRRVYGLDAHIKVENAILGIDDNYYTVDGTAVRSALLADSLTASKVQSMSLIADKSVILKTDTDFRGLMLRGVDRGFDWSYLRSRLISGRVPDTAADTADVAEVVLPDVVARQLRIEVGQRVAAYFIDERVRVRKLTVVGTYSTDFDTFDNTFVLGNIRLLQQLNDWGPETGNFVAVECRRPSDIASTAYRVSALLAADTYTRHSPTLHAVSHTYRNNVAFFSWLDMLDMNVAVILVLMAIVAGFTLIAVLLMVVLERIATIGLLKALGAANSGIRQVFILLTQKLIVRALIIGDVVGVGLALAQQQFHIVRLDPQAYYMPYVPVSLGWEWLLALNVGVLLLSYLTLAAPSMIISTINPTATMRFE